MAVNKKHKSGNPLGQISEKNSKSDEVTESYLERSSVSAKHNPAYQPIEYCINDVKTQRSKSLTKLPSDKERELPPISYQLEEELRYSVEHCYAKHIRQKTIQHDYHLCSYEQRNFWAVQIRIRGL